ncbi:MAG: hypothetical protein R3E79_08940 [Caldilineaceae bacterium]
MWEVEYLGEAWHYLLDNSSYIGDVLEAMQALRKTKDGVPTEGAHREGDDILFSTAYHLIIYRRYPTAKKVVVSIIKPLEF